MTTKNLIVLKYYNYNSGTTVIDFKDLKDEHFSLDKNGDTWSYKAKDDSGYEKIKEYKIGLLHTTRNNTRTILRRSTKTIKTFFSITLHILIGNTLHTKT